MTKLKIFIVFSSLSLLTATKIYAESTVEEIGDYTQVIVPISALLMSINKADWEGTKQLLNSFAAMNITVMGLKNVIKKERPNGNGYESFPSGHTASAFSGASFIHRRYGIKKAIVPYLMAGFTGYSRIAADKHYLNDVMAAAAISSIFTWIFVSEYDLRVSMTPNEVKFAFRMEF